MFSAEAVVPANWARSIIVRLPGTGDSWAKKFRCSMSLLWPRAASQSFTS